jgi:hypothetical protein
VFWKIWKGFLIHLYEDLALNGLYGLLLESCLRDNRLGCIFMYTREQETVVNVIVLYSVYTAIYADKVSSPAHDVALYKLDQSFLNLKY